MKKYPKKSKKSLEADLLRSEYLKTPDSDRKKKNFLIEKLVEIWMPYVLKRCIGLSPEAKKEVIQIYRVRVLELIYTFKGSNKATFKSYLHFAAKGALDRYLLFENKVRREHNYTDLDTQTAESINFTLTTTESENSDWVYTKSTQNNANPMYFEHDYHDENPNCIL